MFKLIYYQHHVQGESLHKTLIDAIEAAIWSFEYNTSMTVEIREGDVVLWKRAYSPTDLGLEEFAEKHGVKMPE